MTELENYIREHAADFDVEVPARGHERRFLARGDFSTAPGMTEGTPGSRGFFGGRMTQWGWGVALAAAVVAAAVVLMPGGGRGYFRWTGNNPEKVYLAYLEQVESVSRTLPQDGEYNWEGILRGMTEEGVPMIEQLPEALSGRQQARILKKYYGDILAGVEQLKKAR